jgi:hypothetical protein
MGLIRPIAVVIVLFVLAAGVLPMDASALDPDPQQDQRGNATPVLMGKNVAEAGVGQEATGPKARLLSPSVSWVLELDDSIERRLQLDMYQSNDVIFGKGKILAEGIEQNVSASGTTSGDKLHLDVLSDDLSLFRLTLTQNGKSIYGDYHIYSTRFLPQKGIAMGRIGRLSDQDGPISPAPGSISTTLFVVLPLSLSTINGMPDLSTRSR